MEPGLYEAGSGEALMLGGNRHGVLSNPDKMSSAEHLLGNYVRSSLYCSITVLSLEEGW